MGGGECADANFLQPNSWYINNIPDINLATCQENCAKTLLEGGCVGVSFVPEDDSYVSECFKYAGIATPAIPVTTTILGFVTLFPDYPSCPGTECYRYLPVNTGKVSVVRYITLLRC